MAERRPPVVRPEAGLPVRERLEAPVSAGTRAWAAVPAAVAVRARHKGGMAERLASGERLALVERGEPLFVASATSRATGPSSV